LISLRRVARLLCGVPADGVQSAAGFPNGRPSAPPPAMPTSEGVYIKDVIDQITKVPIIALSSQAIRDMYLDYKNKFGGEPNPEYAPTDLQLSGLHQILMAGHPPTVDFAVFGPHGKRLMRKLTFSALKANERGEWVKTELSGPGGIEQWERCYKTWRYAMLLLRAATIETLDSYSETIKDFVRDFGHDVWWLIYQGDSRMRNEKFELIRRQLETTQAQWSTVDARVAALLAPFDPNMPWDAVLRRASSPGHEHWDREIRNKISAYKLSITPAVPITSDESAQPTFTTDRQVPWLQQPQQSKKLKKTGCCSAFNSAEGCVKVEAACPEQAKHACGFCGRPGHAALVCFAKHPELADAKARGKGSKATTGISDVASDIA
jgi:hypothetical protein